MIHACPKRMWYVEEFLVPSMLEQGIPENEIVVWNDEDDKGCLVSCMDAFRECGKHEGGTWHLQDDVIICRDFAERTSSGEYGDGIVCGFVCNRFEAKVNNWGDHRIQQMWYSFQCIHIPNYLAGECAEWFFNDAVKRKENVHRIAEKKYDDQFFREFMLEKHGRMRTLNLKRGLVDHIDFLIGGTIVNKQRTHAESRGFYFEDKDLVDELEEKLKARRRAIGGKKING